ncbi:acyl-CoA thioester hydrolase/thioesterase-3 [Haloferula luteola]|uniref:Acyl-CoA thioester hydrolase/thioesterase-3 n=1 Tax=Haloferula luteola TaxID=595692 RepID=A0A840V4S0_9BACT|nr:acyl-CoA thioesterase [Haloferula luteola]MBB5353015.1 acyl-CoA thioester hydrolase/thioesterase-3 [Haloferula luteola]
MDDNGFSIFTTRLQVRPDDIDLNAHVHHSRYLDYVLAARFDQMERCYGMSMGQFLERGLSWFVRTAHIEHLRPLAMGQWMTVETRIGNIGRRGVRVDFEIHREVDGRLCAEGYFDYQLVSRDSGRPVTLPEDIVEQYSL